MDLVTAAEDAGIIVLCPGFKQGGCCQLPAKSETAVPKKGPTFPASALEKKPAPAIRSVPMSSGHGRPGRRLELFTLRGSQGKNSKVWKEKLAFKSCKMIPWRKHLHSKEKEHEI